MFDSFSDLRPLTDKTLKQLGFIRHNENEQYFYWTYEIDDEILLITNSYNNGEYLVTLFGCDCFVLQTVKEVHLIKLLIEGKE